MNVMTLHHRDEGIVQFVLKSYWSQRACNQDNNEWSNEPGTADAYKKPMIGFEFSGTLSRTFYLQEEKKRKKEICIRAGFMRAFVCKPWGCRNLFQRIVHSRLLMLIAKLFWCQWTGVCLIPRELQSGGHPNTGLIRLNHSITWSCFTYSMSFQRLYTSLQCSFITDSLCWDITPYLIVKTCQTVKIRKCWFRVQ